MTGVSGPVRYETSTPSSHDTWYETWTPMSGSARRLTGLICVSCGRSVSSPSFFRAADGRDLLFGPTCEELLVQEVMEL